jgi:hypothetical protein
LKDQLFASLNQGSVVATVLAMSELFEGQSFSLQHIFAEERQKLVQLLAAKTKQQLDQIYTQVYRDNYSLLVAFQREELPVPPELQVAAEIALSHRCRGAIAALEKSAPQAIDNHLAELAAIAAEANQLQCQLAVPEAKPTLERLFWQSLWQLLYEGEPANLEQDIQRLVQAIDVGERLHLDLSLERLQELYYYCLQEYVGPHCLRSDNGQVACRWLPEQLPALLGLGRALGVNASQWLSERK